MLKSTGSFQVGSDRWILHLATCIAILILSMLWMGNALSAELSGAASGAKIFEAQCAGCHAGGGNIVRRGKNLKLKTLQKNKYDSLEAIVALVTQGKGNMSAYADRITPEEIQTVSAYVLSQAEANWK